jgi:hypothetical protein
MHGLANHAAFTKGAESRIVIYLENRPSFRMLMTRAGTFPRRMNKSLSVGADLGPAARHLFEARVHHRFAQMAKTDKTNTLHAMKQAPSTGKECLSARAAVFFFFFDVLG